MENNLTEYTRLLNNPLDIGFCLLILLSMIIGYKRGFITSFSGLVKWTGAVIAGFFLFPYPAHLLLQFFPSLPGWQIPTGFLISALSGYLLAALLIKLITLNMDERAHQRISNKLLGILSGFVTGLIITAIISRLLISLPLDAGLTSLVEKSNITTALNPTAKWIEEKMVSFFPSDISNEKTPVTRIIHDETITLGYKTSDFQTRPDLEEKLIQMVNNERTSRGLKPLKPDAELREVARDHSADMFTRGYFSHYTPEGYDPFKRMNMANVSFKTAGENLALAKSLSIAHEGLMHSSGHRANILNPAFGRVGIGIMFNPIHGLMISQEFRN